MESGFLQVITRVIASNYESFYPCFNGIRVLTHLALNDDAGRQMFLSLF